MSQGSSNAESVDLLLGSSVESEGSSTSVFRSQREGDKEAERSEMGPERPRKKHKKPEFHARWFCFTWTTPPEDWKAYFEDRQHLIEKLVACLDQAPGIGTPRVVGWLKLTRPNNPRTWLQLPHKIAWDLMPDTERKNTEYRTTTGEEALHWGVSLKRNLKGPQITLRPWQQELWDIIQEPVPRD